MTKHEDILNRLDQLVGDLAGEGLYSMADRLEEFTGDLEEALIDKRRRVELDALALDRRKA